MVSPKLAQTLITFLASAIVFQSLAIAQDGDPRLILVQAYEKTKGDPQLSTLVEIVNQAKSVDDNQLKAAENGDAFVQYKNRLLGWTYNRQGEIYAERNDNPKALTAFEMAVQHDDAEWMHYQNRGVSYAIAGKLAEAKKDFGTVIELNPSYVNAHFNLAEIHFASGAFAEAVKEYLIVAKAQPSDAGVHNRCGHAYFQLGDYTSAKREYEAAVGLDAGSSAFRADLGDGCRAVGEWKDAVAHYKAVLQSNTTVKNGPDYNRALLNLAWLQATCPQTGDGDPESVRDGDAALTYISQATDDKVGAPYRRLEILAAAKAAKGDYQGAQIDANSAIVSARKSLAAAKTSRRTPAEIKTYVDAIKDLENHVALYLDGKALHIQPLASQAKTGG